MTADVESSADVLEREARTLSRYIVGAAPADELVQRYVAGCRSLLGGPVGPLDRRLNDLSFACAPLLPALDAAAGLLRPNTLLRRKLLLASAILETCPEHCDHFLPEPLSWPRLLARFLWTAACTVVHLAVGVPLLLTVGLLSRLQAEPEARP